MTGHVVSNTGPIIDLTLIDRLDILNSLFQIVTVSDMVHKELHFRLWAGCISKSIMD